MSTIRKDHSAKLSTAIDTTRPHEARFYDYWLGGRDNYPVDRRLGDEVAAHVPGIRAIARANRAFLGRAVRYAITELGITQFLDIGTGLPTARNVHQVAQEVDPTARIVYVDKDPLVLAHARALMSSTPQGKTAFIHADLHEPDSILHDPILADTLDLNRPISLMMVSMLMYFPDAEGPHDIIGHLVGQLAPASSLSISHATGDVDPAGAARASEAVERSGIHMVMRDRDEVEALFMGVDLIEPGVVHLEDWHPELGEKPLYEPEPLLGPSWGYCGMGRKS